VKQNGGSCFIFKQLQNEGAFFEVASKVSQNFKGFAAMLHY
jgi:hypothetical protein